VLLVVAMGIVAILVRSIAGVGSCKHSKLIGFHDVDIGASSTTIAAGVTVIHAVNAWRPRAILSDCWHLSKVEGGNATAIALTQVKVVLDGTTDQAGSVVA